MSPNPLQSLIYKSGDQPTLQVLDQLLLPEEKKYIDVPDIQTTWSVIRNMQIRGAPLIAIVASLGLAVDLKSETTKLDLDSIVEVNGPEHGDAVLTYIQGKMDYLATSRPTAVNLFNALNETKQKLLVAKDDTSSNQTPCERMVEAVLKHAQFMLERDVQDCKNIGRHGADQILHGKPPDHKVSIMTICNTGSLATSAYGTALGVVRAIRERNQLKRVVALETRPYNQGSRLTAFEIMEEEMPGGTLICDSMAAAMMRKGEVDAVVVGADRVCANGDTANKIGTYGLALVAAAHHIPVYVAAPCTTLDVTIKHGEEIEIEERPAEELLSTSKAPNNIGVWNPAFDVTPARYLAGIVTEKGVVQPDVEGKIDVAGFVRAHTNGEEPPSDTQPKLQVPLDYNEQTIHTLPTFLAGHAHEAMKVLGTTQAHDLECKEFGDGNLNLVFIVKNRRDHEKAVIVKQALPYVRCVGHSWPMTLERAFFEYMALSAEKEACPDNVPSVYYFSKPNGLIVMEYLAPPIIILRKGLIQGIRYPTMATDMGTFCAKTLFKTSGFKLTATELRKKVEFWTTNVEMCSLTEQVIFTEPYMEATNNRWTSPQLDEDKKAIENDVALKVAAAKYKQKFITETQALIHGDLHSGSVMSAPKEGATYVIDPEFAFYGPMGFDTGAFVANLFLAYVSQAGHSNGEDYADWILGQIQIFWRTFSDEFCKLWNDPAEHTGFWYGNEYLGDAVVESQAVFLNKILSDTLGFAGMKMLRRIVGIAHVEDLDSIQDADVRAGCERHGLEIAKTFIKTASAIESMEAAVQIAKDKRP